MSSLFYPATLYAVSVALFGTWGLLHATIVAAIWFSAQVRVLNLAARFVAVIVVLLVAISSALPPI